MADALVWIGQFVHSRMNLCELDSWLDATSGEGRPGDEGQARGCLARCTARSHAQLSESYRNALSHSACVIGPECPYTR